MTPKRTIAARRIADQQRVRALEVELGDVPNGVLVATIRQRFGWGRDRAAETIADLRDPKRMGGPVRRRETPGVVAVIEVVGDRTVGEEFAEARERRRRERAA